MNRGLVPAQRTILNRGRLADALPTAPSAIAMPVGQSRVEWDRRATPPVVLDMSTSASAGDWMCCPNIAQVASTACSSSFSLRLNARASPGGTDTVPSRRHHGAHLRSRVAGGSSRSVSGRAPTSD